MNEEKKRKIRNIAAVAISASIIGGIAFFNREKVEEIIKKDTNINNQHISIIMPFKIKEKENNEINTILSPTNRIKDIANKIVKESNDTNQVIKNIIEYMKEFKPIAHPTVGLPAKPEEFEKRGGGDCNEMVYYLMTLINEIQKIKDYDIKNKMALVLIDENGKHMIHAAMVVISPKLKNEWKTLNMDNLLNTNGITEEEIKNAVIIDLLNKKVIGITPKLLIILNEKQFLGAYYADAAATLTYLRKYELAEKYFNIALKYDKDSPITYYNISKMYEQKNEFKKAERYARKVIELAPNWSYGYFMLAQIYYWQDKYKSALEKLIKAKEVEPEFPYYEIYAKNAIKSIEAGLSKD